MVAYLAVGIGGAIGAIARYGLGGLILDRTGTSLHWDTVLINVVGSFLIGLLGTLATDTDWISATQRRFLLTGILGGFTTYSAFSFEFQRYIEDGDAPSAFAYLGLMLIGGLVAVFSGVGVAKAVA